MSAGRGCKSRAKGYDEAGIPSPSLQESESIHG